MARRPQRSRFSKAQHRPRQNHADFENMNDWTETKISIERNSRGGTSIRIARGIREAIETRGRGNGCRKHEPKKKAWDNAPATKQGHSGIKKGKHGTGRYFIKQCLEEHDNNKVIQLLTSNIQNFEKHLCSEDMPSLTP